MALQCKFLIFLELVLAVTLESTSLKKADLIIRSWSQSGSVRGLSILGFGGALRAARGSSSKGTPEVHGQIC